MCTTLKKLTVASLMLGGYSLASFAAESTVYRFDGGSVTITPGRSQSSSALKPPSNVGTQSSLTVDPRDVVQNPPRILVRPVSQKNNEAAPQPNPMPDVQGEVVPPFKATPEPTPILPATTLIHVMPTEPQFAMMSDSSALPAITPKSTETLPSPTTVVTQAAHYREVYASIPFSRVEYNANPSYRHDATMEFLFNQLRPTVINRGTTNVYHYNLNSGNNDGDAPFSPYYGYNYGWRYYRGR